jgi:colanic acid biosynthesis protein WcaH
VTNHAAHSTADDRLNPADFKAGVAMLPLVAIDLLVRNPAGEYLLGLRVNPPAADHWFVPGGRIRKNENLACALRRLAYEELALEIDPLSWRFSGVYEHFYDINFAGEAGRSTHYVVLAYHLQRAHLPLNTSFPTLQHQHYRWCHPQQACADAAVHPYTKAYFTENMT